MGVGRAHDRDANSPFRGHKARTYAWRLHKSPCMLISLRSLSAGAPAIEPGRGLAPDECQALRFVDREPTAGRYTEMLPLRSNHPSEAWVSVMVRKHDAENGESTRAIV